MNHAEPYLDTMRSLVPLFRESEKFCVWKFDMLCDWHSFFWNRGTISFRIDENGKGLGVCTIKLFSRLEQFLEPFVHEPVGRYAMIEVLSSYEPQVRLDMLDELIARWGTFEVVLWDRGRRTQSGAPRMYRWEEFMKLARRHNRKAGC